jgi:hypothetical protein
VARFLSATERVHLRDHALEKEQERCHPGICRGQRMVCAELVCSHEHLQAAYVLFIHTPTIVAEVGLQLRPTPPKFFQKPAVYSGKSSSKKRPPVISGIYFGNSRYFFGGRKCLIKPSTHQIWLDEILSLGRERAAA